MTFSDKNGHNLKIKDIFSFLAIWKEKLACCKVLKLRKTKDNQLFKILLIQALQPERPMMGLNEDGTASQPRATLLPT